MSADVLSKHLILPLISMSHLAFSSADPLGTTSETDLEKVRGSTPLLRPSLPLN